MNAKELTTFHGVFPAYLSWSQSFIHRLIDGLEQTGRQVVLCERRENAERFSVERVEQLAARNLADPLSTALTGSRLARRWQPDLVHAHMGPSALRMMLLVQLARLPFVATFAGRDLAVQASLPGLAGLYTQLFDQLDLAICVSRDLARRLEAAGMNPDRIEVVHRGVMIEGPTTARPGREGPLRILMVGRLVPKKGHADALEALAELRRRGVAAHLTIVGEGPLLGALRRQCQHAGLEKQVDFEGVASPARVTETMAEAQLILHCSVTDREGDIEGIPNVLLEAGACGLPALATRHGGISELVMDGETGWLIDEGDIAGIVDILEQVESHRERLELAGAAARRRIETGFALDRQVARHAEIYEQLARTPARASLGWRVSEDLSLLMARAWDHPKSARELATVDLILRWLGPAASGPWGRLFLGPAALAKRLLPAPVRFGGKRLVQDAAARRRHADLDMSGQVEALGLLRKFYANGGNAGSLPGTTPGTLLSGLRAI